MNSDLLSSESKKIIHKALSFAQKNSNPELNAAHILKSIVQSTNNSKSLMLNQLHGNKDSLIIALDAIIDTYPIDFDHCCL